MTQRSGAATRRPTLLPQFNPYCLLTSNHAPDLHGKRKQKTKTAITSRLQTLRLSFNANV